MVKRKFDDIVMQGPETSSIPLAIQSFLWRQTEPFFRQKLGKLYEASCVLFEHVLVENKLNGLPPSLYEAVTRTPRRVLIEAALPHVMHCASVMLSNRNKLGHADILGVAATKLLHTFHSILYESMDTAQEANDDTGLRAGVISNIQLFVFLFAPLANTVKESDLKFRLASGIKTWEALWNHEIPDIRAMNSTVKPTVCNDKHSRGNSTSKENGDDGDSDNDVFMMPASSCNEVTAFDVAVLRCMFFPRWSEEGLLWGVTYLLKRLLPSEHNKGVFRKMWRRSKSVSTPKYSNMDKPATNFTSKRMSSNVQFTAIHEKAAEQTKRPQGFLGRLRFSEKRRKSSKNTNAQVYASLESWKDLSPEHEEKEFKERKFSFNQKMKSSSGRKRFKKFSSIQLNAIPKNTDEPPTYDALMKRENFQHKRPSLEMVPHSRQLQRMEHVAEEDDEIGISGVYQDEPTASSSTLAEKSAEPKWGEDSASHSHHNERAEKPRYSMSRNTSTKVIESDPESIPINRRWASDTCVSYNKVQCAIDSEITSSYVTSEGFFRSDVILQAIEVMVSRDPGVKIYDACLQILECIIENVYVQKVPNDRQTSFARFRRRQSNIKLKHSRPTPEKDDVVQLIRVMLKIIRAMGCVRNCSRCGHRGSAGERLRLKARSLLVSIYENYDEILCDHISNLIKSQTMKECVELLHLIFPTCEIEFNSTKVPDLNDNSDWMNNAEEESPESKLTSAIAKRTFEAFVHKCLAVQDELYNSHCRSLYRDVREIVQYIKHKHPPIFNKLLLNVMLTSAIKWKKWKKEKEQNEVRRQQDKNTEPVNLLTQRSGIKRRGAVVMNNSPLLPRAAATTSRSIPTLRSRFSSLWNENSSDSEPVSTNGGNNHQAPRSGSVFGKLPFSANWLRHKHDSTNSLDLDETISETCHPPGDRQKHGFMSMIKGKPVKKQMSAPNETLPGEDRLLEEPRFGSFKQQEIPSYMKNFIVDEKDIYAGLRILRFLIESCPPGTVPEPKILAAALDLESPVVCRAAFLLEVMVFVHRCTHGDWPKWMSNSDTGIPKMFVRATRHRVRNNLKLQATAGYLFHTWGDALGKQLEYLCQMESGTTFVLPNVRSDAEKIRLREKDIREDFLLDNTVNRSGSACPVALKKMAAQLLHEITTFVRDVAPHCKAMTRKISSTHLSRSDEDESINAFISESTFTRNSALTPSKISSSGGRRKSISFLDDPEKKNTQPHSLQVSGNLEMKQTRKSAPESALRNELKSMPFHSPRCPPRTISMPQDFSGGRRRSIASTGTALEDLNENSPLMSNSSISICVDSGKTLDDLKTGKKSTSRGVFSNYLTVPSAYAGCQSTSGASHGGISPGSSMVSLGDSSVVDDDPSIYLSAVSIASSHIEGSRSPTISNQESRQEEEWITKIPWIGIMLALTNQQNFVCEHKNFCHAYCHQRLERSCRRLVQALCKALDCGQDPEQQIEVYGGTDKLILNGSELYNDFVSRYLKTYCASLMSAPLLVLTKSAALLSEEMFFDVHSFCWEMILDENKDISTSAAVLFLLCAVKSPQQVFSTITSELTHLDANLRLDAILKFQILWNCRFSVWQRAQDGATRIFKLTKTGMSYTLPKETIGTEFLQVPDAPWLPYAGSTEETILAQSSSAPENSALLTTDTTSHQKEKQLKKAIRREEEARAAARKKFNLINIPIIRFVAIEVQKSAFVAQDDDDNEALVASRRYSHAPSISSSTYSGKDARFGESSRPSSRQLGRVSKRDADGGEYKQEDQQNSRESSAAKASAVFPPCIAACIPIIVNSCQDAELSKNNFSVGEMAQQTIESCLIEDPSLFLRHMFEKLSGKDGSQRQISKLLQKLPSLLGGLSPHVAYTIFINVLGIMMKAVRSLLPGCDENVISCIGILASVAPYVEGLEFKALKMAFRKEQMDLELLITSALPGPRKLTIWNNSDYYMPSLVDVNEESTFENVIIDAMHQNDIPESEKHKYQLVDRRLNKVNCPHSYVRDFYSFNKKVFPELTLVQMEPEVADKQIKARAILTQLEEINKLRFTLSVLLHKRTLEDKQLNASFILDEFLRLKCFPRKAIQAPFQLFSGKMGRQIFDIDMMQKSWWIQLISTVFHFLPSEFPWGKELLLFLHVWNAALVLHAEQTPILRRYGAALIDAAVHMNHQFIKLGYSVVLPTILEIYSEHFCMPTVKKYIEFLCKQLHIIHRHPFVLELIACAAPILTEFADVSTNARNRKHLSPEKFFTLLQSLEREHVEDELQVLELVRAEQPLQSLDFCYKNDNCSLSIMDCLRLCVTVVAFQPESSRTLEMLIVFDQILPCYLDHLHKRTLTTRSTSHELSSLKEIVVCIRALLVSLECLTRNLAHTLPQQQTSHKVFHMEAGASGGLLRHTPKMRCDSVKVMEEGNLIEYSQERFRALAEEFLAPRDIVLHLCSKYFTHTSKRLRQLEGSTAQSIELLNEKSHARLAEIAQSLLKLLTEEAFTIKCPGLMTYLTEMIPVVDWTDERVRATLFLILKRLDRLFIKINGMPESSRQSLNWSDLRLIIEGLGDLISNQPVVSVIPHIKSIVTINLAMLIGSSALLDGDCSPKNPGVTEAAVPRTYVPAVLRLTMIYMNSMGNTVTLEDLVRHFTHGKRDFVILNFFIPLAIYASSLQSCPRDKENSEQFSVREADVMYMFNYAFEILAKDSASLSNNISQLLLFTSPVSHRRTNLSHQTSLLLVKVLITCFRKNLHRHWYKISTKIKKIIVQRSNDNDTWLFMNFIMSIKTPLVLYLRSFVLTQMMHFKIECSQLNSLKEHLHLMLTYLRFNEINMPALAIEYERDVIRLKADITANAPGSKSKSIDKSIRESTHRSFRHAMLPGGFGRKASDRADETKTGQKLTGENDKPEHASPMKSATNSVSENTPAKEITEIKQIAAELSAETATREDKNKIRRRWTQRGTTTRVNTKKGKKKRHSVSTTQCTATIEDQDTESNSKIQLTPRSLRIPFIKIEAVTSPMFKRAQKATLDTDDSNDEVNPDLTFENEISATKGRNDQTQERKISTTPNSNAKTSEDGGSKQQKKISLSSKSALNQQTRKTSSCKTEAKINSPLRSLKASNIQVCVTAPTPPGRRRSSAGDQLPSETSRIQRRIHSESSYLSQTRGRKISTTTKPDLNSLLPDSRHDEKDRKSRDRKLSPLFEVSGTQNEKISQDGNKI
uniref:protein unc-80 homolog isoform X1 n=1 Tax=Styela clava TaxID=7725 RepID=UPI00193A641B|nr:protein unc-80 homolog isoform X1 [Styela clava]